MTLSVLQVSFSKVLNQHKPTIASILVNRRVSSKIPTDTLSCHSQISPEAGGV